MSTNKYGLLEQLLPWLAAYEEERGGSTHPVADFSEWLAARLQETAAGTPPEAPPYLEGEIAQHLAGLYRYARFYAKKGLKHTQLESLDDFGYLICLLEEGSLSKVALSTKNIQEIPSGTEVIKRLLRRGWIAEKPDEQDRRSVQVAITEAGKAALMGSFGQIASIAKMVSGNLSLREKLELLRLLKKLSGFHYPIFVSRRNEELEDMLRAHHL